MIEKIEFGKTGHLSTRLIFGAAAFYHTKDQDLVYRTMDIIDEAGINHIDTAKSYGESQRLLGPWLRHNRDRFFLATKTECRTYKEAKEDIYKSLELMQVDSIDLWQMHCVAEPAEWETAKDPQKGAIRAFIEAKEEGLVKFLGMTSHGMKAAQMCLNGINEFDFDSILTVYNYPMLQDPSYRENFAKLSAACQKRKIAMQLIKAICKGPLPEGNPRNFNTWYEPLTDQEDINTAISWAMNQKHAFINSAAETTILPKVIKAAQMEHKEVTDTEMAEFAKRVGLTNLFG